VNKKEKRKNAGSLLNGLINRMKNLWERQKEGKKYVLQTKIYGLDRSSNKWGTMVKPMLLAKNTEKGLPASRHAL